jgi:hypothetical protein
LLVVWRKEDQHVKIAISHMPRASKCWGAPAIRTLECNRSAAKAAGAFTAQKETSEMMSGGRLSGSTTVRMMSPLWQLRH